MARFLHNNLTSHTVPTQLCSERRGDFTEFSREAASRPPKASGLTFSNKSERLSFSNKQATERLLLNWSHLCRQFSDDSGQGSGLGPREELVLFLTPRGHSTAGVALAPDYSLQPVLFPDLRTSRSKLFTQASRPVVPSIQGRLYVETSLFEVMSLELICHCI